MIALVQRVSAAAVLIDGLVVAEIARGVLALIGVRGGDDSDSARRLAARLLGYRMFADKAGRMNLSVRDVQGGVLLVPQFTLAADTRKGLRAGFAGAAEPGLAQGLYEQLVAAVATAGLPVGSGVFGAHMRVQLENDGPVTFWLES